MARGKNTCRILKSIRRQIAEANDIEFVISTCRYKGDCRGTCPKCETEVRYLEQQLQARMLSGKAIALAGISAGMIFASGCHNTSTNNRHNELQDDTSAISAPAADTPEGSDTLDSAQDDIITEEVLTFGYIDEEMTVISDSLD